MRKAIATLTLAWIIGKAINHLRKVDAPVHLGGYSDGKWIDIVCDGTQVEPKWGTPDEQRTEDKDVYVADDDRLYTFRYEKTTCFGCRKK